MPDPIFEVFGPNLLVPRLPHGPDGGERVADGLVLLDLDTAATQFGLPADVLAHAYSAFLSDVADPPAREAADGSEPPAAATPAEAEEARRVLRRVKYGHLPDEFFSLFLAECRARGLSPWGRHLWVDAREDGIRGRRELVMGYTIDGFRAEAAACAEYAGQGRQRWCDADGNWSTVWLEDSPPTAAEATVHRQGFAEPLVRVVSWREYAPYWFGERGDKVLPEHWAKSPAAQLARVAEAVTLRAAFPERFAKMYLPEEFDRRPTPPRGAGQSAAEFSDADAVAADPDSAVDPDSPSVDNEMSFAIGIVNAAEIGGRQVPAVIAAYERKYPGLHRSDPLKFYRVVLGDLRRRRAAGEDVSASDSA